jgi:hypothetical protein
MFQYRMVNKVFLFLLFYCILKIKCHEIFCFWFFFRKSSSPKPLVRALGSFRFFSKIRGDIYIQYISCEYLREFKKKFETVLMGYSGAGGKLINEKT